MSDMKYLVVATYDHGEDKLATVGSWEFADLKEAITMMVGIARKHGEAGDGSVSYVEITALDPDENLYVFCSTHPDEVGALEDFYLVP